MRAKIASTLFVVIAAGLTSGVAIDRPSSGLIAHAGTLSPQPIPPASPAVLVEEKVVRVNSPVSSSQNAPQSTENETTQSFSWILAPGIIPGNNCVACVQAMTHRAQSGNAGSHRAAFSTPRVGAIMIFRPGQQGAGGIGHVGVVAWTDGHRVKLRHCNWGGGQVDFYSTGLFY